MGIPFLYEYKSVCKTKLYLDRCLDKDSQAILNEKRKQDRQVRYEEAPIRFWLEVYASLNLRAERG